MKKILLLVFLLATFFANAQSTIWSENFDTENLSAWTLIDEDGDGWTFGTTQMLGGWPPHPIGTPYLYSLSYTQYNNIGNVFPDNWAITPQIDLSAISPGQTIHLNWAIVDSAYSWNPFPNNENYAVYIAASTDTVAFIAAGIKYTERNIPIVYTMRTLDISAYAGQLIYIAFRHYNVSDSIQVPFSSSLEFDDMSITVEPLSISQYNNNSKLMLFPNPVNDRFQLNLPSNFNVLNSKVEIQDITGRIVASYKANSKDFNVIDLPSGVYIAIASDEKQKLVTKLIKE